jgi:hypothetical protein
MTAMQDGSDSAAKVSLAEVRTAAAHYANPHNAILLLVGNRNKIEAGLRELELGPITLLDADSNKALSQ